MSEELVQRTPTQQLVAEVRSPELLEQVAVALPTGMAPERFIRVTVTAIMQNPELVTTDRTSLFQAVIRCAQDGLLPDGREAALVIFGGRDGKKATYMPMIAGFRKIAAEHGWAIDTQVVCENDEFDYELGITPMLTHRPPPLTQERGKPIGAYAVGTHADGRTQVEVLTQADIEKVRLVSRAKDRGPWVEWPERMWEKTAGRRLFAKLPLGGRDADRIARVLEANDAEYELPVEREPMTVMQADASAAMPTSVPVMLPPADLPSTPPAPVITDGASGDQAAVEGEVQVSFAEMAETAQTRRKAKEEGR